MKLCVIPARGGSKRIPGKNVRPFCGKPIMLYSIEAAHGCGLFDRIVVSTDSEEIAALAREHGAEVPFLRPAELSDDHTGTGAVARHALEWFREQGTAFEWACCVYATASITLMPVSPDSGRASARQSLNPIYPAGLWDAVTTRPPSQGSLPMA